MPLPNQQITDANYRYAFQGQEKDPETGMEAFELRLWDGRLGRWLTVDPYGQYFSPYLGMGNNPISRIDPDGGMDGGPEDPPIEDGCVFFPTEEGYITGSSISDWQNLDYQVFNDFVKNNYCQGCTQGRLNDVSGDLFEKAFVKFGLINFESEANFTPVPKHTALSEPDAYSDGLFFQLISFKTVRYHRSVYWEVKGKKDNVTYDKQIKGFMDLLYEEFKYSAIKTESVNLSFVTFADKKVNLEVYARAKARNIQVHHWVPRYTMRGNKMLIDFGVETGPLNPPMFNSDWKVVRL